MLTSVEISSLVGILKARESKNYTAEYSNTRETLSFCKSDVTLYMRKLPYAILNRFSLFSRLMRNSSLEFIEDGTFDGVQLRVL